MVHTFETYLEDKCAIGGLGIPYLTKIHSCYNIKAIHKGYKLSDHKSSLLYYNVVIIYSDSPNMRRCMLVIGLNDPHPTSTTCLLELMLVCSTG